ncbi:hypothetical protein GF360_04175 [candidate division WWE3 bacterium]|nr:hypothetical protein [candidate division WWE3 bacterium]
MIENWPKYFKDRILMENLNSSTAIATLWMPKEMVAEKLTPQTFAACGQLYTKGGINYLLRNILANPKIRHLFLCGIDRQESGIALKNFFEKGVEPVQDENENITHWAIKNTKKAFIDKEIPLEILELLRQKVAFYDFRLESLEDLARKVAKVHEASKNTEPFTQPITFPEAEKAAPKTFPTDRSVFKIRRKYIGEAWLDALKTVTRFGRRIPGMYGEVGQVQNLSIVVEEEDPASPEIYDFFNFDKKQLDLYIKGFFDPNEPNKSGEKQEVYTYGERIFKWGRDSFGGLSRHSASSSTDSRSSGLDPESKNPDFKLNIPLDQEKIMVEKLKRFNFDRGALAVLWEPHNDNFPPSDIERKEMGQTKKWRVPCMVMILGQVVDGKFDMTAVFRNNDIYGAWPLNVFALRAFQKKLSHKISCEMGVLTTISHIAEIYEINWEAALAVVAENDHLGRTCQYDPRGYYTVCLSGDDSSQILVTFFSPEGTKELAKFSIDGHAEKAARDLSAMIFKDLLVSDLGAACDLGRQLAKAEAAVKLGLTFEQDQPLRPAN